MILYRDSITESMRKAIGETDRRRRIQQDHNEAHGITPQSIRKKIKEGLGEVFDGTLASTVLQGENKSSAILNKFSHHPEKIQEEVAKLRAKMKEYSANLEFEEAAKVRDEIKRLQIVELNLRSGEVESGSAEVLKDGLK